MSEGAGSPPGGARPSGPGLTLTDDYLADVLRVESRAENQSGADKTWVERMMHEAQEHLVRAERIR